LTEHAGTDREVAIQVKESLKQYFKPEFLNRIDELIVFHRLDKTHMEQILDIQLLGLKARLAELKIKVTFTDEARALILQEGYDPLYGARPLKRALQQLVENPLAEDLLDDLLTEGDDVQVTVNQGRLAFKKES
jgi:ATP-dependent Clp protease ATP-binding subunit ClpB